MILAVLLGAAVPIAGPQVVDLDELAIALVIVRNPLAEPSAIPNSDVGDAFEAALRAGTALSPLVIDPTTSGCADLGCYLALARLETPAARAKLGAVLVVSNEPGEGAANVLVGVLPPARVEAALSEGVAAARLVAIATATVASFAPATSARELDVARRLPRALEAAGVPRGAQGSLSFVMPAEGSVRVDARPSMALQRGRVTLRGLAAGRHELRIEPEGYEPVALIEPVAWGSEVEPSWTPIVGAGRWARRVGLWGGVAAVSAGAVVLTVDGVSGAGRHLICVGTCEEPVLPLLAPALVLMGVGAAAAGVSLWLGDGDVW